jgi:flagellar hook-basal body complex protein FliE
MEISQISNLVSGLNTTGAASRAGSASASGTASGSFTNILSDAMGDAQDTEVSAQAQNIALLTGETDDLHTPIIEAQKAELALNLAIQVRNKVVEAYNQVMNMQV